jgi:hypothetical protein
LLLKLFAPFEAVWTVQTNRRKVISREGCVAVRSREDHGQTCESSEQVNGGFDATAESEVPACRRDSNHGHFVSWDTGCPSCTDTEIARVTGKVTGQSVEPAYSDKRLLITESTDDISHLVETSCSHAFFTGPACWVGPGRTAQRPALVKHLADEHN